MSDERRPSPDALLRAVQSAESVRKRGRLKIFLGMAAGVGKTYSMLEAAQNLRKQGIKVFVGCVYTHGRQETAKLLEGLEEVPQKQIVYKGIAFEELDIDEILRIKPQVVLVDEFAHTNVPGSRHLKRWQDVEELLDRGIDVFTTLNVQHIESLKDIVESITGVQIRETVPDSAIETAANIELVDLTPEELLQRLRDGKVYLGDKHLIAAENFFQQDRLTALREIILRFAAEKVDHDLHGFVSTAEHPERWRPREKLLVAISEHVHSQKLIRATRRIAFRLNAPWIAVHVDDGRILNDEESEQLAKNLNLARNLGGEVITTNDPAIAEGVRRTARQRGITQIVIGRPVVGTFRRLFKGEELLDTLVKTMRDIDIHVVGQEATLRRYRKRLVSLSYMKEIYSYLFVFLFVLGLSLINEFFVHYIGYKIVGVIFLMGLLFLSLFFRKGPIFFASVLYGIIWAFFFVPPHRELNIFSNDDKALLFLYFLTAIATGILVDRAREHKKMLSKREESAQALYDIVRLIAMAETNQDAAKSVKEKLERLYPGTFEILQQNVEGALALSQGVSLLSDEKEKNAAIWAFENGKEAGWSTDTLPLSKNLYIPLQEFEKTVGLLIYRPKANKPLGLEERNFLYTVCRQLGNYLEMRLSEEKEQKEERMRQIKHIHTSILNRISLVFQHPLLISQSAIQNLKSKREVNTNKMILSEISKIENSLELLIEILANITAMASLSEGMVSLNKSSHEVEEVVQLCLENLKKVITGHKVMIYVEENLPKINIDFPLIEILLLNLITNAVFYSPIGSTIEIRASLSHEFVVISVVDEGKGIPNDQLEAIFDQSYRLPHEDSRGIGLGLSAAKAIAEVHKGKLKAENRPEKGAIFRLYLPVE